ncbi:hypothetical protein [Streptomyces sp. PT12]|uniref:hypothetical protein n=1 Tax=Streptomyces sp. PT12 TaxID=1510197 RepID=UPI0015EF9D39|nr:hypothetical protein [Streptomyces sp. PT12]
MTPRFLAARAASLLGLLLALSLVLFVLQEISHTDAVAATLGANASPEAIAAERAGLGSYLGASIPVSDFPAVAGVTLVLGAISIVANTAADVLQGMADPRVAR